MKKGIVRTIVLLGTLDTKGLAIGYIQDQIRAQGHETIVIDAGILDKPEIKADISREEVAKAGGTSLEELLIRAQKSSDRMQIIQVMIEGAAQRVKKLCDQGKVDGLLSVGGSMGTAIGVGAMKNLPLGIPKLMVATHFYPQALVGESDLTVMQCPADIMGLNPVINFTFAQADSAICAMAEVKREGKKVRPLVAMTGLGVTTPAVMKLQKLFEPMGYDNVVFHGNSEVLDQLVEDGVIDGILDFSPQELLRIFVVKEWPWRKSRLESAGRKGLPQVIVPGSLDMIVLRVAKDNLPAPYKNRKIYMHGPFITAIRTNVEELNQVAEVIADKASRASGPQAVVFPLRGFSAIDKEGFAFYDPATNRSFLRALKEKLKKGVEIIEVDAHILDDDFVKEVARVYDKMAKRTIIRQG
jgi:uncharacterized protein (UPF0261 family)